MFKRFFLSVFIILVFCGISLANVFLDGDLEGNWNLKGKWYTIDYDTAIADALIVFDSDGNITAGTWKITSEAVSNVTGSYGAMGYEGTFTGRITTDAPGPYDLTGIMNESKDTIVCVESPSSQFDNSLMLLTGTDTTYADSDVTSGTWHLRSMWGSGSVTSDGAGNISGGTFTNEDGTTETVASSAYTIDANYGRFEVDLTTDSTVYELKGAMNESKDIISVVKTLVIPEVLSETAFATHVNWDAADDFDDTGGNAAYAYSAGSGTLTQNSGNFETPVVGDKTYDFTYTIANSGGDATANLTTAIANEATELTIADGTQTTTFTTAASPGNFVISVTSDTGDDVFDMDDVSLKESGTASSHFNLGLLVKKPTASKSDADFSGTWYFKSIVDAGRLTSDGTGNIIGGEWNTETVSSGTYSVGSSGDFEANITTGSGDTSNSYNIQGIFNYGMDIISCAVAPDSWGENYDLFMLVKNYAKQETVGAGGSTVEVTNSYHDLYQTYVDIPSGALSTDKLIGIDKMVDYPSLPSGLTLTKNVVDFTPTGLSFNSSVTLALPYASGTNTGSLRAYKYDTTNEEWDAVTISSIDSSNDRALVTTTGFSIYALGTVETGISEDLNMFGHSDASGTCFIATAAYGTPFAKEVKTLCRLRDKYLLKNKIGQTFVNLYYKYSPPIADYIRDKKFLKTTVRTFLKPVVWYCDKFFDLKIPTKKSDNNI